MMHSTGWISSLRKMIERLRRIELAGQRGERYATRFLQRAGYNIVGRNVRLGHDEVDIVAIDPDGPTLVVVEVKSRTASDAQPELSVDRTKQHRLTRCAAKLKQRKEYRDVPLRFDVISVRDLESRRPEIKHIMHAFDATF